MRKRTLADIKRDPVEAEQAWLDLERHAVVEITSEDEAYPVEGALLPGRIEGWRAAEPGVQTIRLLFDEPAHVRRIFLHFEDARRARTQEYILRWSADEGQNYREVVRQQWNFSPDGTTTETEDYAVDLPAVTVLELVITPDVSGGDAIASLEQLRLA
jgi:hypothetical protein